VTTVGDPDIALTGCRIGHHQRLRPPHADRDVPLLVPEVNADHLGLVDPRAGRAPW
jgi:hypothetical protein